MNSDQFRDAIMQHLDALAAKLNTTAVQLWGVLIRQARVEAIIDFSELIGLVLLLLVPVAFGIWTIRRAKTVDVEVTFWCSVVSLGAFALITPCLVTIAEAWAVARFNPEYWALTKILSGLK